MADPDSTPHNSADSASLSGISAVLREVANAPKVAGALRAVALPTPLHGIEASAEALEPGVPPVGTVVAERYRLDAVLGAGGMGVVFAASHLQTEKPVALKWLVLPRRERGAGDHARALARFAREARVAGRIRHPNVVDVYDASSDERTPFLVMERLEGETLRARIERAPLSWDELMTLLVPALRGVSELHRQGIVHRDLKPDNVFLAQQPGSNAPCAKVLDFGVSRLRSHDSVEDSLTRTGAIVGTPAYMPLEQLRGDDGVDARTDVYALGVVLFESLTGKRPWQARTAAEYGALLAMGRPTRLSALVPTLKGPREAALMKALERDPEDRYPNVEAMIAALEAAARPRSPWARRLVVALAVCVLLGAAAGVLSGSREPPARPATAASTVRTPSPPAAPNASPPEPTQAVTAPIEAPPASQLSTAPVATIPQAHTGTPRARRRTLVSDAGSAREDQTSSPAERALEALQPREPVPLVQPTDRATSLDRGQF